MVISRHYPSKIEVFKYACTHSDESIIWDKLAIQRIEYQLKYDSKLERLYALIFQNAIARKQLNWFSSTFQTKLKLSTYNLIADIGAKKNEISRLTNILEEYDLNILLLKGLAFNSYIYSDNFPRGSSDIDILIKPKDKNRFCSVFEQVATEIEQKTDDAFGGMFESSWRTNNTNNTNSIYFDLHWYLSYPSLFKFDECGIAERSIKHPHYSSENIRLLSNEDHLVYLAVHMAKDCDFYHYGLIDCHELICQQKPDLLKCFDIAEEWGVCVGLYYLLKQCNESLGTPIERSLLKTKKCNFIRNVLCYFAINFLFVRPAKLKSFFYRVKQLCSVFLFCDSPIKALKHNLIYIKRSLS